MLEKLREQLTTFWNELNSTRKAMLIGLSVVSVIALSLFINWASTPTFAVAFSGLNESDAGQIVEKLTAANIPYELQGSGTIKVPSEQVYEVRLQMAKEGLPQGGSVGFELFSGNSLGMTEFTQRVNYQRAMEGELERTIVSLNSVSAVRVHIVTPEKALLTSQQQPATASVTLKISSGEIISTGQVQSITHLVASSVEGLKPENVVIVDVNGNLLAAGLNEDQTAGSAAAADTHHAAELAYANQVENNVRNLLDSVLGPNRSVVKASVLMDWTERQVTTQVFTPDSAIVRSEQLVNETYSTDDENISGIPGAETNLPTGEGEDAETAIENANTYVHTEEVRNYEISQTETMEVIAPGIVNRISLSVMVDGLTDTAQLQSLQTAIAAAAGIDIERGDLLAVETLEFDHTFYENQAAELEDTEKTNLYIQIGQAVAAVLVIGALLWYIQRLLSNLRLRTTEEWAHVLQPASEMALSSPGVSNQLPLEATPDMEALSAMKAMSGQNDQVEAVHVKTAPAPVRKEQSLEERQLQESITKMADENPSSIAEIIHLWLSEDDHADV